MHRYRKFPIGTRVRVTECSGLDSGRAGVVIAPALDSRGIPMERGAYNQFRPAIERMIRWDGGELGTMFVDRLKAIGHDEHGTGRWAPKTK